jgi:hypothetical protein
MATVTGMTAEKILDIVGDSVVTGVLDPVTNVLTLQTRDGQSISAGQVNFNDAIQQAVDQAVAEAVPLAVAQSHPVGSIFMSASATNPATQLGFGTWVAWGKGRVPVGVDETQTEFDGVEETGGAKTHVLTMSEMPGHTHNTPAHTHPTVQTGATALQWVSDVLTSGTNTAGVRPSGGTDLTVGSGGAGVTSSQGGGLPHNNLPPYITCYMWKRTA